jgi:hypothetical protein
MKKMLILMLCIGLIPVLHANTDRVTQALPDLKAPYRTNFVMPELPPTDQDTLWAQYPSMTAAGMACQHDPNYPFDAWLLDDVIPPTADYGIEEVVTWWANWNGFTTWTLVPEIYFQVYEDSGLAYVFPKMFPSQEVTVLQADFTATTIGADQYLVEMTLPSTVVLPAGEISWICVQPNNDFVTNGQTGWMGEPGIGNGQQCYFAFPLLGNDKWVLAETVFGTPNEAGFALLGTEGGPAGVTWDFETGWQDWTHTNGGSFPAAWDVLSSQYKSGSGYVCPAPGDSSMWIDSDAISGTWVQDTALSPVLVPLASMDWLVYGYCYNDVGTSDWFEVGIKYYDGGWNAVPLKTYTSDNFGTWDSVDVSAYAGYDYVQVYVYYDDANSWAWYLGFDNVSIDATIYVADHDVGCTAVLSPPAGPTTPGDYDVIGRIQNFGNSAETFDVTANVYDTVGMVNVFSQTVTLTGFPVSGDSNVNFGQVTFEEVSHYYTEIFTELSGDVNPTNDTSSVYSTTAMALGDVVFELDVETPTGNNRLLGVEFDGGNFYVTGGNGAGTNSIWVVDTNGTVVTQVAQPTSSAWGMRDLAWDGVYAGPDRIDTLYGSDESGLYKFGIDLTGTYDNYGTVSGPVLPCRALAWDNLDEWFFTANWGPPYYKFSKSNPNIQSVATGPGSSYGAAYDTDPAEGDLVWWHSQVGPTGCQIDQMEPAGMSWPGVTFAIYPTITTGIAGGLCFYEGFRDMDVLFALVQGAPDAIVGVFVRPHDTGIEDEPGAGTMTAFGFAPVTNPTRSHATISYAITKPGMVSLKVYDGTGRLVETLVNNTQEAGIQTVTWDAQNVANGVYFLQLEAENQTAVHKLILVK